MPNKAKWRSRYPLVARVSAPGCSGGRLARQHGYDILFRSRQTFLDQNEAQLSDAGNRGSNKCMQPSHASACKPNMEIHLCPSGACLYSRPETTLSNSGSVSSFECVTWYEFGKIAPVEDLAPARISVKSAQITEAPIIRPPDPKGYIRMMSSLTASARFDIHAIKHQELSGNMTRQPGGGDAKVPWR
jgi:hypothetical protein